MENRAWDVESPGEVFTLGERVVELLFPAVNVHTTRPMYIILGVLIGLASTMWLIIRIASAKTREVVQPPPDAKFEDAPVLGRSFSSGYIDNLSKKSDGDGSFSSRRARERSSFMGRITEGRGSGAHQQLRWENPEDGYYSYLYPRVLSDKLHKLRHLRRFFSRHFGKNRESAPAMVGPMHPQYLLSDRGTWLYTRRWLHNAANPSHGTKAIVFLAHGWGEHGSRYEHVGQELARQGYDVYNMDFEGHGQSEQPYGCMGYFERFDHLVDDLEKFVRTVLDNRPDTAEVPKFLVGHSMGSLVSFHVALRLQKEINGLIMLSPFIQGTPDVEAIRNTPWMFQIATWLSEYLPKTWYRKGDISTCSRVSSVVASYMRDPLLYRGGVYFRVGLELIKAGNVIKARAGDLKLPILIFHGEVDRIARAEGSLWLFQHVASKDRHFRFITDAYHELLHEVEWAHVLSELWEWMEQRCEISSLSTQKSADHQVSEKGPISTAAISPGKENDSHLKDSNSCGKRAKSDGMELEADASRGNVTVKTLDVPASRYQLQRAHSSSGLPEFLSKGIAMNFNFVQQLLTRETQVSLYNTWSCLNQSSLRYASVSSAILSSR